MKANIFQDQQTFQKNINQPEQQNQLYTSNYLSQQQKICQQIIQADCYVAKQSQLDLKNKQFQYLSEESKDEEEEEEISIWNENDLNEIGVNTEEFIDDKGKQLEFYQLYRLRSILYQSNYVSRLDTIKEVQCLSEHFDQKISINQLKEQQMYLDNHILNQAKENKQKKQSIKLQKLKNQYKESLVDSYQRADSSCKQNIKQTAQLNELQQQKTNQINQEIKQVKSLLLSQTQTLQQNQKTSQYISQKSIQINEKHQKCQSSLYLYYKKYHDKKKASQQQLTLLLNEDIQIPNKQDQSLQQLGQNSQITQQKSQEVIENNQCIQNEENNCSAKNNENKVSNITIAQNKQQGKIGLFQTIYSTFSSFKKNIEQKFKKQE
ncbi:hypothetical protein ABPG72_020271 [Tetrahymena utriculariae]